MSYASKQRKKYKRWLLDQADPERKNIRNLIKRGKLPRLTMLRHGGKTPKLGRFTFKNTGKRAFVLRMSGLIRFTSAVILSGGRT